jgi:hypothetical protein
LKNPNGKSCLACHSQGTLQRLQQSFTLHCPPLIAVPSATGAPTALLAPAVSLKFLLSFLAKLRASIQEEERCDATTASRKLQALSTADVAARWVVPATQQRQCAYVHLPGMQHSHSGQLQYMVTHAWQAPFVETVELLSDYMAGSQADEVFLWIGESYILAALV